MNRCCLIFVLVLAAITYGSSQSLEFMDRQEIFDGAVSETMRIPIRFRNTSDKAQFYIIRKTYSDLGGSHKGYFCLDNNCLESGIEGFSKRLEPGETLQNLFYTIETGLVTGQNNIRFEVFVRGSLGVPAEYSVSVNIGEKREKNLVFQSKDITIQDVYPNPVSDQAFIDYRIHNESIKARVVIHNILGRMMNETELPVFETKIKIQADELVSGIYFYTLYLDNEGVLTRKLIVRK